MIQIACRVHETNLVTQSASNWHAGLRVTGSAIHDSEVEQRVSRGLVLRQGIDALNTPVISHVQALLALHLMQALHVGVAGMPHRPGSLGVFCCETRGVGSINVLQCSYHGRIGSKLIACSIVALGTERYERSCQCNTTGSLSLHDVGKKLFKPFPKERKDMIWM
jgi:hypothetical protein